MIIFCNLAEPNKSMANKKYPKNDRVFLRGDGPIYWGIWVRGKSHHTWVWMWMWGVPGAHLWNSSKQRINLAAVCTVGLWVLAHNSCLWLIKWGCIWQTKKESTSQNRRLWSRYFKFLHNVFSDYTKAISYYYLRWSTIDTSFSGKGCWKFFPVLFANAKGQLGINIYDSKRHTS